MVQKDLSDDARKNRWWTERLQKKMGTELETRDPEKQGFHEQREEDQLDAESLWGAVESHLHEQ